MLFDSPDLETGTIGGLKLAPFRADESFPPLASLVGSQWLLYVYSGIPIISSSRAIRLRFISAATTAAPCLVPFPLPVLLPLADPTLPKLLERVRLLLGFCSAPPAPPFPPL